MTNWYKNFKNNSLICLSKKHFDWTSVDSSFITHVMYLSAQKILGIKLKNGSEYLYKDIPLKTFRNFQKSRSKGKFFNDIIKKRYTLL